MNRQDAKNAKVCEPPRRQERRDAIEINANGCFSAGSFSVTVRWVLDLNRFAWRSWRLGGSNRFLGALGVLAVRETHA
jgi:hypothetical protein